MTTIEQQDRALADPIGLITDLVSAAEPRLAADLIRAVAVTVGGGRAKTRRLAAALAQRPEVLVDGRSPAPRVVGDLLRALRAAGATVISPPCCATCGKPVRTEFLATQHDPVRRKLLHRYLIWHLIRRLRTRNNGRPTTRQQALRIRAHRRAAEAFLDWLGTHNLTLGTFRQGDLDRWLTDPAGGYRYETATFIRWAHANKLTTAYVPAQRWRGPVNPLDDDHRWATARRLLHDSDLDAEDRLAGLLLLLYAQGPSTISLLTTDQIAITNEDVRISFGRAPIRLPDPVANLARAVVATRKGHATIGATAPSRWLFPGGQPGRPISTQRLKQ